MMKLSNVQACCICAALLGCEAQISPIRGDVGMTPFGSAGAGAGATSASGGAGPAAVNGVRAPVHRLNRFEYDATISDLLGVDAKAQAEFPADETALSYDNNAGALMFSPTLAEQLLGKAQQLAPAAVAKAPTFAACAATEQTPSCARAFVVGLGARAFRRPLTDAEVERSAAVMQPSLDRGDFKRALELATQVILTSYPFLYRVELGTGAAPAGKPGLRELSSFERAARLSYTLWGTMPDDTLSSLASQGGLSDRAALQAQTERLLADPRARRVVARFHEQWLQLKPIESANHDPQLFPDYTPEVPQLLRRELDAFLDYAAFEGGGLRDVLSAPYTFVNDALAKFYGISGVTGADLRRVDLDSGHYAGLLTRAGVLSQHAGFDFTSPTRRGAYVRRRLLCQELAPPPPGVVTTPPPATGAESRRELVNRHSQDPSCKSCHELTDPIGLGLEDFDATGRYRALENGAPIDTAGAVTGTSIGVFRGAAELGQKLAVSPEAQRCYATQLFRYLSGRQEQAADEALLAEMSAAGGDTYRQAILGFVTSDQFFYLAEEAQ